MKTPGQCPPKEIVWQVIERKEESTRSPVYSIIESIQQPK
jgi:hypothetical protein